MEKYIGVLNIGFVFGVTDLKGSNSNSIVTFTGGM